MIDIKTLLPELKKLVTDLSEDLLVRSTENADIDTGLREAYTQIEKGGRTGDAFEVWREDYLDQVAVAWVLGCVFVRFMEDNHLIDECWLAGEGDRRTKAENEHELYFRAHPKQSDREYFEHVFHEVGKIPACHDLFAEGKTPLWAVGPSGDAAMKLLAFWREIDSDSGHLKRTFDVEDGDTRFVGDLYQDLSERARKKYALLQTPVFVEEFILNRTLDPAIDEFGLDEVRLIDPTCGSGHFLLGTFNRLFKLWSKREDNERVAAQKALDGVWGVDINPFAVAIARFRLIVAAIRACGITQLKDAPGWNIHLATGDSLLFGSRWDRDGKKKSEQQFLGTAEESWAPEIYACEDKKTISEVLDQQYHAVVGNPPYIIVRDKCLNQAYRDRYSSCYRSYSLAVPFAERFFDLAFASAGSRVGYVGMITANSFMKREFGKKLIEEFFPRIDLTHVVDTTGAYIPGHTTSTVILFGRNRRPASDKVRAVLGIQGEPSVPPDASKGVVWNAILQQIDRANASDSYVSTKDVKRATFSVHPWSIGGGGTTELKELLASKAECKLGDLIKETGFGAVTRLDDVFIVSSEVAQRHSIPDGFVRALVTGDEVRNWRIVNPSMSLFPYDSETFTASAPESLVRFLWPWKAQLSLRSAYGASQLERGLKWFEYSMLFHNRFRTPMSIAFACVATHNHFVLDRGGKLFNRHAPIIKLDDEATEEQHHAVLGLLNSSAACFWMKQVMSCKGLGGQGGGIKPEHWSRQYEFAGTMMQRCPIPASHETLSRLAGRLDSMAVEAQKSEPSSVIAESVSNLVSRLKSARSRFEATHRRMVFSQEELDWAVYSLFGLCEDTSVSDGHSQYGICPSERPVERILKQRISDGEASIFYDVHSYRGTGHETDTLPDEYCSVVETRLKIIRENSEIKLIEQLDFKRRWQIEPWEKQQERALRSWLLDRLESGQYWPHPKQHEPRLQTVTALATNAGGDEEFLQVAAIYRDRSDFEMTALITELVESESVPLLPKLRYKASGLRKRTVWEQTWELQRREDAGEDVGDIKVPPKYSSSDFQKSDYWRLRGKLDVPKERWISFPHCERDGDDSLVVGWGGWDHLQQATAIVAYYDARKNEGWTAERLKPLLAAIDQLLPWIHQWHPEIDPEYNETAGTSFQTLLESEAHELGLTLEDIRNWTPPKKRTQPRKSRNTRKKKTTT